MGKKELKEQLDMYVNINNELTVKICYLLLGKNKFVKARIVDGLSEEKISQQIKQINIDLEKTEELLKEHYKNNGLIL